MQRFVWIRRTLLDMLSGPRIVFHHVPKCGGTSVAQALRLRYAVSFGGFPTLPVYRAINSLHPGVSHRERDRLVEKFQEQLLLYYLHKDVRCVSGHVRFSNAAHAAFAQKYRFITTIREPVSLLISHFFFQPQRPTELWASTMDIEAYLDSEEARALGGIYSHYFNGLPPDADPHSPAAVKRAKENLQRLDLVGLVDDMQNFQRRLSRQFGIRLRIGFANKTKARSSEKSNIITPQVRQRIEDLSATNLEIYDYVKGELAREAKGERRAGGSAWRLGGA